MTTLFHFFLACTLLLYASLRTSCFVSFCSSRSAACPSELGDVIAFPSLISSLRFLLRSLPPRHHHFFASLFLALLFLSLSACLPFGLFLLEVRELRGIIEFSHLLTPPPAYSTSSASSSSSSPSMVVSRMPFEMLKHFTVQDLKQVCIFPFVSVCFSPFSPSFLLSVFLFSLLSSFHHLHSSFLPVCLV